MELGGQEEKKILNAIRTYMSIERESEDAHIWEDNWLKSLSEMSIKHRNENGACCEIVFTRKKK